MVFGRLLYSAGIRFYNLAIFLLIPFNKKAGDIYRGRQASKKELQKHQKHDKTVWVHCASLGEFEQGRPVIEALKKLGCYVVLSFFSPSGYQVRKNYQWADKILYLPADTPKNASIWIEKINPTLTIFVKYEFWIHYLTELHRKSITTISISTIFRPEQLFFRPYGRFYLKTLKGIDKIFTQDRQSLQLLDKHGVKNTEVGGDTRFDRVYALRKNKFRDEILEQFKENSRIFIVGSCWSEDLALLETFIRDMSGKMKFILAPHSMSENYLRASEKFSKKSIRYSRANSSNIGDKHILIIDNIGMLSNLYRYGEYAYVGGGFGAGLHNVLEPATFGLPVFFGNKNYKKFREANELIERDAAFPVGNSEEFKNSFRLIEGEGERKKTGDICYNYVLENTGATDKIVKFAKYVIN